MDLFRELRGSQDPRAATDPEELAQLAVHGRIETLLVSEAVCAGGLDDNPESGSTSQDLNALVDATLSRSGTVRVVPAALLGGSSAAAILRF